MLEHIAFSESAAKVFVFDQVYPLSAAAEQAKQKKLNAFGLHRFNPFNHPKENTVLQTKHELRYEPFWYVAACREVDFLREINYQLEIGNPYAHRVLLNGSEYAVTASGKKRSISIEATEYCHRKIDYVDHLDGLNREIRKSRLENYVANYKCEEQAELRLPEAVALQLRAPTLRQEVDRILSGEVINAHEVQRDVSTLEKTYLYWRPVFAFEFVWTTEDKVGVIEVDGLTGEVSENGQWFKDKIETIATREMLFEVGAELAGAIVPGGGIAVRVVEKLTTPPKE